MGPDLLFMVDDSIYEWLHNEYRHLDELLTLLYGGHLPSSCLGGDRNA